MTAPELILDTYPVHQRVIGQPKGASDLPLETANIDEVENHVRRQGDASYLETRRKCERRAVECDDSCRKGRSARAASFFRPPFLDLVHKCDRIEQGAQAVYPRDLPPPSGPVGLLVDYANRRHIRVEV